MQSQCLFTSSTILSQLSLQFKFHVLGNLHWDGQAGVLGEL